MKRFSKVSFDDIKTIQVDSGVLLKEFDVENPIFLPENVICATSGGINPVCAPEYYDFGEDVDNAKTAKETKRIRGWNATISFTTLTTSLAAIKLALGAADISGKVLNLRQRLQYAKDFKDIWWVGKRADDKLIAIRLIRSLSDSGFSLQTNKRGKGQISITLKGHSSFSDKNKIPMEIYAIEEYNEPVIPDVPVVPDAPAAALYLYGTPSTTGNIGLRVGDTVTYYDGWVLPKLPDSKYTCFCANPAIGVTVNPTIYMIATPPLEVSKFDNVRAAGEQYEATGTPIEWWDCYHPYTEWEFQRESAGAAGLIEYYKIGWSNMDIYYCDDYGDESLKGTLARAKDEYIPVTGIVDNINGIPIYEVRRD